MDKANEIMEKMRNARTWKEAEVTIAEVINVLEYFLENEKRNDDSTEVRRLKSKVERLTDSNKKLMEENKKLKGAK